MTTEQLEEIMNQCYGTGAYYKTMLPHFYYTDGVKTFCENAGAYWFLTDVIAYSTEFLHKDTFFSVKLVVKDSIGSIIITDGNRKTFKRVDDIHTDCPDGEWKFYIEKDMNGDSIMLYYMEH